MCRIGWRSSGGKGKATRNAVCSVVKESGRLVGRPLFVAFPLPVFLWRSSSRVSPDAELVGVGNSDAARGHLPERLENRLA